MKKMILSIVACLVLILGAAIAWCFYLDVLAAGLFASAIIPSCLFEAGRKEYLNEPEEWN